MRVKPGVEQEKFEEEQNNENEMNMSGMKSMNYDPAFSNSKFRVTAR